MTEHNGMPPSGVSWWGRTADGGIRRIWATKAGGFYFCALEICTPDQEAARARLFAASEKGSASPPSPQDIETWSGAQFAQLRTADVAAAYRFLGSDETARLALLQADPALTRERIA